MRKKLQLILLMVVLINLAACKKDSPKQAPINQITTLETGLKSFSIQGQFVAAIIDTNRNTILAAVPNTADKRNLIFNYTTASEVSATLNGSSVSSGSTFDFSSPITLTVTSADKKLSTSFTVTVQTELEYDGFVGAVIAQKSLNKTYYYYFDQFDGSNDQGLDCGPSVMAMVLKWADSTSVKTPALIRKETDPTNTGTGYDTRNIMSYLTDQQLNLVADTIDDIDKLIKTSIDNNQIIIFSVDMHFVPYNDVDHEHTGKFYQTPQAVWTHFIIVKGYKQVGETFYAEVYDPYSHGDTYALGGIKGIDRYFTDASLKQAAAGYWPFAMIIAPKGKQVISTVKRQNVMIKR